MIKWKSIFDGRENKIPNNFYKKWKIKNPNGGNVLVNNREGCYYVSIEAQAHEPRRIYTYVISVYIIKTFFDYSVIIL